MQTDIESILGGPEYFFCTKAKCRLRMTVCIERQERLAKPGRPCSAYDFEICSDCGQGARNIKRYEKMKVNMEKKPDQRRTDKQPVDLPVLTSPAEIDVAADRKICIECNERPTISRNSTYCAKCMAARGNRKRREKASPKKSTAPSAPALPEQSAGSLTINFGKYSHVLKAVTELAEKEMRSVEMQVVFMLSQGLKTKPVEN